MMQSDRQRILKMIETGRKLMEYVARQGITEEDVENSYSVQWTITTPLYNIGEHTYQLSKTLKAKYPDVPWSQIAGMRHRLVHQYEDTNWRIISVVIFEELGKYIDQLEHILPEISEEFEKKPELQILLCSFLYACE